MVLGYFPGSMGAHPEARLINKDQFRARFDNLLHPTITPPTYVTEPIPATHRTDTTSCVLASGLKMLRLHNTEICSPPFQAQTGHLRTAGCQVVNGPARLPGATDSSSHEVIRAVG